MFKHHKCLKAREREEGIEERAVEINV